MPCAGGSLRFLMPGKESRKTEVAVGEGAADSEFAANLVTASLNQGVSPFVQAKLCALSCWHRAHPEHRSSNTNPALHSAGFGSRNTPASRVCPLNCTRGTASQERCVCYRVSWVSFAFSVPTEQNSCRQGGPRKLFDRNTPT